MKVQIPGGWYDDDIHRYEDDSGNLIPSITQVLRLQGLTDYSTVDPEVLENAARRGTEIHRLAAAYNVNGEIDPAWISEETRPYFDAYMAFLDDSGFVVDKRFVEAPMIAIIAGFRVGITPDCFGMFGKTPAVIEFKCTATEMSSWSIQTCAQEMAIYNCSRPGRARRHALMLRKDGKYRLLSPYKDHDRDLKNLVAALTNVWWRIEAGQDVMRTLAA